MEIVEKGQAYIVEGDYPGGKYFKYLKHNSQPTTPTTIEGLEKKIDDLILRLENANIIGKEIR